MTAPRKQRRSGRWRPNGKRAVVTEVRGQFLAFVMKDGRAITSIVGDRAYVLAQLYVRGLDRSALWIVGDATRYAERKLRTATGRLVRQSA